MYGFSMPVILQKNYFYSLKKKKLKLFVVRVKQSITDIQCAAKKKYKEARATKEEKLGLKCFGSGKFTFPPNPKTSQRMMVRGCVTSQQEPCA